MNKPREFARARLVAGEVPLAVMTCADELGRELPELIALYHNGYKRNWHRGWQLYVSHGGKPLIDVAMGDATNPQHPLTTATRVPWLSAGKPLTAVALAVLQQQGELQFSDSVARHIPEFAAHGKAHLTLEDLLTHQAGLRHIDPGYPDCDWAESLARMCAAAPEPGWVYGTSAGYHIAGTWFVLGEVLQRVTQLPFERALHQLVFQPSGMTGVTMAEPAPGAADLGWMWEREQGALRLQDWHEPPRSVRPSPGSSARGPIRELGHFYEALLAAKLGDERLLTREAYRLLTSPRRVGRYDQTLAHIVDFGGGVILNSNAYGAGTVPYGYGPTASAETFGHGGSQCSIGFCDPARELVVAWMFNGRPGEGLHQRRNREVNREVLAWFDRCGT